jgi:hypothetical protein
MSRTLTQAKALHEIVTKQWGDTSANAKRTRTILTTLPNAIAYMATITPDGYPTSTPGAPDRGGSRSTNELTSVEAAYVQRNDSVLAHQLLTNMLKAAALTAHLNDKPACRTHLKQVQTIINTWQLPAAPKLAATLRCTGGEGLDELNAPWKRPDCTNISDPRRNGLCTACHMRRYRHNQRHAMATQQPSV